MRYGRGLWALTMVAVLGFGAVSAAEAQEQQAPAPEPIEVTTEVLERFVKVYPAVMEIAQTAQAQLSTAESAEAAQAIQGQAQEQIMATLEAADFTAAEYEAIVSVLNADEALREEFEALLQEEIGEPRG